MHTKPNIYDPRERQVQVILTDASQLGYVLESLLAFTGAADITVSTYSTGEEFLRKLLALRRKGLVRSVHLFTGFKAAAKTVRVNNKLCTAYDVVYFFQNHREVIVIEGKFPVVVLSSQNQTRGNRLETYAILQSREAADYCLSTLRGLATFRVL